MMTGYFLTTLALAQSALPGPLRLHVPFEAAWNGMGQIFKEGGFTVSEEDRGRGLLRTTFVEFSSGPLTDGHIAKLGERPELADAYWTSVQYQYEVLIEMISEKETLVTVYTNIRAKKRDFFGKESWVSIESNGERERELLHVFGRLLFGEKFQLDEPKKGFWERGLVFPRDINERTAGPERP
jgi:hypothetical protein